MSEPKQRRADRLRDYFGWPGATIHQISRETGVEVNDLLYGISLHTADHARGQLAGSCAGPTLRAICVPYMRGKREFWIGVAESE